MNCWKCERELVKDAAFCSYCGERASKACSECAAANPADSLYCHHCGIALVIGGGARQQIAPRQTRPTGVRCPRCQSVNEPDSAYCYECGLPIEEEAQPRYIQTHSRQGGRRTYESARVRANWTVGLLVATCIAAVIYIVITFGIIESVSQIEAGYYISLSELDEAILGRDIIAGVVAIPTVVSFLMWNHRVSRNLRSLSARGQRFTPGWAVGWWFVPIMFYFHPYQVMAEIWRGSSTPIC